MSILRRASLAACLCFGLLGTFGASAQAATVWNLEMHHHETNFPPGGKAQYWLDLNNVGSSASSGQITIVTELPAEMALTAPPGKPLPEPITEKFDFVAGPKLKWNCSGTTTVTCKTEEGSIPRHTLAHILLEVEIDPGASGEPSASVIRPSSR